jgi:hypothetical protein
MSGYMLSVTPPRAASYAWPAQRNQYTYATTVPAVSVTVTVRPPPWNGPMVPPPFATPSAGNENVDCARPDPPGVRVGVGVGVGDGLGVAVRVGVGVGLGDGDGVAVAVGVAEGSGVAVAEGVSVA